MDNNISVIGCIIFFVIGVICVTLALITGNMEFVLVALVGAPFLIIPFLYIYIQRKLVRNIIGDEEYSLQFIASALNYLGHKTKELSYNRSLIVDDTSLVQMTYLIDSHDIDEICVVASSKGLTHMAICDKYFGKDAITDVSFKLAEARGVEIFDVDDVYKTVYEKIKINRKLDKTVKTENQSHA